MAEVKILKRKCPKCFNFLRTTPDGDYACLTCSYTRRNSSAQHRWIELNKVEIIDDFHKLGRGATAHKWQLQNSTIQQCLKRWGVLSRRSAPVLADLPPNDYFHSVVELSSQAENHSVAELPFQVDNHLPAFPEFSGDWDIHVQLAWISVYIDLVKEGLR